MNTNLYVTKIKKDKTNKLNDLFIHLFFIYI